MSTAVSSGKKTQTSAIVVTALALFSMFFGAGNLIFPPMLAVEAGEHFWPAIFGFLTTGALLPVLAVVAIALSGSNVRDLAQRAGTLFGVVFPVLAYLSIGAFYALPRTGAVSFEVAVTPLFGWESTLTAAIFNIVFFGIALAISWNPNSITDTLGKFLTPALVVLLTVMIGMALFTMTNQHYSPSEDYASSAYPTGVLEGYLTMDSIAALAFSIVVISSLRFKGFEEGKPLVRGTILAAVVASILLALIYLGLGLIGRAMPDAGQYDSGAPLLADAALQLMGRPGQTVFALIVVLACMTTAIGLITSTAEYFSQQFGGSYHTWAVIFAVASAVMATQGLDFVISIAGPVIGFLYPPAIALIFVTLIEPAFRRRTRLRWGFFLPIWVAVVWSLISTFTSLGWGADALSPLVDWSPMQDYDLGWLLPTAVAFAIGVIIDFAKPHAPLEIGTQRTVDGDSLEEAEAQNV